MNFTSYIEKDSSYLQQPVISTNEIAQLRILARQSEQLRLNALTTHAIHKLMALDPEHRDQYAERLARNNNGNRDRGKTAWLN
ncbi:hypothetical protein U14_01962 [Candidatus Moduliflexus flocculans]|uniref:Uncharacterized protein n=1 Tax=Candidatus Moduliflexus flocculans TaxID=1499966 RepID=A0A0S6VXY8_9BACT|nr:hypothetical protein U14_01962 [Candidatus Moduliflexus flocculans]